MAIILPVGTGSGCELYCEPTHQGVFNDQAVSTLSDYSGSGADLTVASSKPLFKTNIINSKSIVRFTGANLQPKNAKPFNVRCGWIVAKYDGALFDLNFRGLLSGLVTHDILTGNVGGISFYNFGDDYYEFRSNDRIYPKESAPAPMNVFKVLFFRFWQTKIMDGIQIGQQRNYTDRNWKGDVGLLALYSRDFFEYEIRAYSQIIADYYALSLANVYPYQADKSTSQSVEQSVNFYDPPEGDRISEVLGDPKRTFELKFTSRRRPERNAMIAFHNSHYASATPCIIQNYNVIPPESIEGYIDSEYELSGALNNYSYGFRFRER